MKYIKLKHQTKVILVLFLLIFSSNIHAQFYVAQDPDGYVNVRSEPNAKSKILTKLSNGKVVFYYHPQHTYAMDLENEFPKRDTLWFPVDYKENSEKLGFIYHNRLKSIESFESIPVKKSTKNLIELANKNINIKIETLKFNPKNKSIEYEKDSDQIKTINQKSGWGLGIGLPDVEYKSITINWDKKTIQLPKEALENLFLPRLDETKVYYNPKSDTLYIQTTNGRETEQYYILWVIEKGKYKERLVVYGF
jgi:hypothetical protein